MCFYSLPYICKILKVIIYSKKITVIFVPDFIYLSLTTSSSLTELIPAEYLLKFLHPFAYMQQLENCEQIFMKIYTAEFMGNFRAIQVFLWIGQF
jgi:hypothetical protein